MIDTETKESSVRNEWTQEDDRILRIMWKDGKTSGQIARLLLRTRNSVIGRAHRLELPLRPSPIKRRVIA